MLSKTDLIQIQQKGIKPEQVDQQINFFKKGITYQNITGPAIPNDGILILTKNEITNLISKFESEKADKKLVKFVPASGAATRMFKSLFEFASSSNDALPDDVAQILKHLESFAFYDDFLEVLHKNGVSLSSLLEKRQNKEIFQFIIGEKGLNYGNLPKGLLKFHSYPIGNRTSLEEHLVEGALYAQNYDKTVNVHFTVSPEHMQLFKQLVNRVKDLYEKAYNIKLNVSFSIQKASTDTIAVDSSNLPFRNSDDSILFRPGGHGALLDNMNDIDADIIFIKNIDNVVPDRLKDETITYKKALAGFLIQIQKQVFEYLKILENLPYHDENMYTEIVNFIETNLGYRFKNTLPADSDKRKNKLFDILNRPIRVCGMVKNEGEPGGGPYWVESKEGALSLQILESTQIDLKNEKQRLIFNSATHFNPVDLVVTTKNYKGEKFDLAQFRDPDTGFISIKSKDGKELKALELPGLWNGSMAFWNTAFVEVPMITFNPVKTINDLLRNEHQKYKVNEDILYI